ncbi:R3H domain-containing protein 2 [Elsinoe fawcettii]|nr:R3H domain-containing protein 2 [Elsinoe fawcettii]
MAKRHKAKGGNQQKPPKRKGFKDKFSRDSSGNSSPYLSMKDEASRTERHHSEWSPSVQLRHQSMTFVSAGNMNPLEESKILASEEKGAQDIDSDLENSDGALAQMHIESPDGLSPLGQELNAEMEVETTELSAFQTSDQDTPSKDTSEASIQDPPRDLFVIDSVGDKSLAPAGPAPVIRDVSPVADEGSEDEVVVFRGRSNRVTVRDDPPQQQLAPAPSPKVESKTNVAPVQPSSSVAIASAPHVTTAHSSESYPVPTAQALRAEGMDAESAPAISKAMRAELGQQKPGKAKKGKGRQSKRQRLDRGTPALAKASFGRIMDDPDMEEDEDEEAMLQDYIANMSGGDELLAALQQDESDWVSSVLDDDEEIEDEIEPTSASAPIKSRSRRKNKKLDIASSVPTTDVDMTDISAIPSNFEDDDDEEDDDDDDDGTSDPGDDSELESDLEYTAQERWEDETDLRQRQIDALTDEEIARMLAKQEELGLGSDELLLLDDSGFPTNAEMAEAEAGLESLLARSKPKRRGGGKKKQRDTFPSASLMADVLDQDPYGGFDVMDFERPSLRPAGKKGRKSAGGLPEELAGLSDEELISDLQMSWANDRAKKAAKKAEREELRAEGLLGRGRANKFRPDLQVKFADGLSLVQLRKEMEDFLDDDDLQQKAMPPMEKKERKLLHEIANVFDLTSTSRGSGKNRFTVFSKRARTGDFEQRKWDRVERIAQRGFLKGAGKGARGKGEGPKRAGRGGGFDSAAVGYRNGEVVGATAPEIAESNFGRKLMEKMGWEKGMALGKGGEGLLLPVEARVKSGRGGLG